MTKTIFLALIYFSEDNNFAEDLNIPLQQSLSALDRQNQLACLIFPHHRGLKLNRSRYKQWQHS